MADTKLGLNITWQVILLIVLLLLLAQCTRTRMIPSGYVIIAARDFAIDKYTHDHPEKITIYQLDEAGAYTITSVAYYPEKKLIAIAERTKEPQKGTSVIKILDEKTSLVVKEFITKKDRINSMAIDREGRIAFDTGDMYLDLPGELCYLSMNEGVVHTIAKGAHFFSPAWSEDSKRIYFGFSPNSKQSSSDRIGYVDLAKPYDIKQIAEGRSVSVSENGGIAYLSNDGNITLMQKTDDPSKSSKQLLRHRDPRFTYNIRFVKGTEDIVIEHAKKVIIFDLIVLPTPYKEEKVMLSNIGMQDFDVAYVK